MNKIYMKIHGFEEPSCSLLVSFASDTTKSSNPDDYPQYAFQPMTLWPDITDPTEIIKKIAIAGIHNIERQESEEKFIADTAKVDAYKAMIGQSKEYLISDIVPPNPHLEFYIFGDPI